MSLHVPFKPVIHFDNDATFCYDRIPCFLANVVSRKYGMHRNICIVQGRTLAEARYHLKTKLGISDEHIQHCYECPWFGTGQGSGNSPMVWLFICSTLFDLYEKEAQGATYESPDGASNITIKIIGFVDDTRNATNFFKRNNISIDTLIQQATRDSQRWHDLLTACNQKLELPKCGYHAIQYTFKATGEPVLVDTQCTTTLTLVDANNHPFQIQQWPATKATKYLGTLKCVADQKAQLATLTNKCNNFARIVNTSRLSRREARCL